MFDVGQERRPRARGNNQVASAVNPIAGVQLSYLFEKERHLKTSLYSARPDQHLEHAASGVNGALRPVAASSGVQRECSLLQMHLL